jgi:hypothetical protein
MNDPLTRLLDAIDSWEIPTSCPEHHTHPAKFSVSTDWAEVEFGCGCKLSSHPYSLLRDRGLPPLHLHALRHMVATEMLRAGERVDVVSEILGHAHVATTMSVYAHVNEADKRTASSAVQRAWEAAQKEAGETNEAQAEPNGAPADELARRRACK